MKPPAPEPAVAGETLDSWKAIAEFLNRDVRTAMRWERSRGLPVHRLPGGGKPGVYALRSELDDWRQTGPRRQEPSEGRDGSPTGAPAVAVLPFANLSGDRENEYWSDGLADEVITLLSRIPGLRVTARTSSFAFRGALCDVREIGSQLGVSSILEGSVQRSAGRCRVSAQLVDTTNGFHVWSDQYDREVEDIFALQDEIARAIARALEVRLEPPRAERTRPHLEAYNHWLKGRHHYYQVYENLEAAAKCRGHLEQAIAIDPGFAPPYVTLAELFRHAPVAGLMPPQEAIALGREALERAITLDGSLGEAHALAGAYRAWADFDWSGAAADFDRALLRSPASAEVHTLRAAYHLVPTGRLREAEEEVERAVESDPVSPLAHIELGKVLLWERQYDRAQAVLEAAAELRPDHPLAVWYRGVGCYFQGRLEEALALWQPVVQQVGGSPTLLGAVGMALGQVGRRDEAREVLAGLAAVQGSRYAPPTSLAQVHLGLGETDDVFAWLERAVEQRDPLVLDLPCKPIWDGLRPDPRFGALLREMRLD